MKTYYTSGVCATEINFQVKEGIITYVAFNGGCPGNLTAIQKLLEGMPVDQAISKLKGIECQNGTSCSDQLAQALEQMAPANEK